MVVIRGIVIVIVLLFYRSPVEIIYWQVTFALIGCLMRLADELIDKVDV